jgi:hypothetical protein
MMERLLISLLEPQPRGPVRDFSPFDKKIIARIIPDDAD